jgi:hypothetical protein
MHLVKELISFGLVLVCAVCVAVAHAQPAPILAQEQILIVGVGLHPHDDDLYQTVPKNIATGVRVLLVQPEGSTDAPAIPTDALVFAELRGPALQTPVTLTARPNEALAIPPFALPGLYTVSNIRLVSQGATLIQGSPDMTTIEVIDKIIETQVSSRPLSAQEIKDRGIVVDQTNFQVVNFTAAFGFQDRRVNIDFPMIVPTTPSANAPPAIPPLQLPALQPATVSLPASQLPDLQLALQNPNISVSGLLLRVEDSDQDLVGFNIPPIPGVIIIPGNIAYLNQFFSVLLMVSNVAPGNSDLVVRDVTAEIILPPGTDTVVRTGDDPLRMARLGDPPVEQSQIQSVRQAGPDGVLGSADDIPSLAPGQSGNSEHLVEGRKEGTHTVEMKISAMLHGLPVGPVRISGRAVGVVEVRNPTFALTLSHTSTVSAGEEYALLVTVTNTSQTPANFVSLNLLPRSISGAVLAPGQAETMQIDTIAGGDSETVAFRLISQTTGTVTATSFTSEGIPGRFEFRTAVGALGIPLSPNSLVLPPAADSLPDALRSAGIGLLGQAFALATSPTAPQGLLPITQQIVFERATELAEAGQRLQMSEALWSVARDLALDFAGNDFARIPERFSEATRQALTMADYRGFDELARQSRRGALFTEVLGDALAGELGGGVFAFQNAFATSAASRPAHLSAITGSGAGAAPVVLNITDPSGQQMGQLSAGGEVLRNVPYGAFFSLIDQAPEFSQFGLIGVPQSGQYIIEVIATGTGNFDLGLVAPEGVSLRHVTYAGVPIQIGGRARVVVTIGSANTYTLEVDQTGDGAIDLTLAPSANAPVEDTGPTLAGAVQVVTGRADLSRFGQMIGLLFSEEISSASSQAGLDPALLSHYQLADNQVLGASLQPGGRVVLLALRDGVGPFVPRSITVTGIEDRLGHAMDPPTATRVIRTCRTQSTPAPDAPCTLRDGGTLSGQVRRGDGTPVPGARLRFTQEVDPHQWATVTVKDADAEGRYAFDYVATFASQFEAIEPETGERGEVRTHIRFDGQHLDLDIILLGTGRLVGRALAPNGTPLPGAVVRASSLTRFGEVFGAVTDASGAFSIAGIPVGNVTIEAAHTATVSRVVVASSIPIAGGTVVQDLVLLPLAERELRYGALHGQVFRADGVTPAAGVPVYTTRGGLATTDASGSYRIENLAEGAVEIRAIDQARLEQGSIATTIVGGQDVTANLVLLGGTGTVRGVVLDADGVPVAGAVVGGGLTLATTDASGQFTLTDVPIGQRTITALDQVRQVTGSATANLARPGEEVTVQIILEARGTIAGRVFEADGATPVPGLRVALLGGRNLIAVTDEQGGYRFADIPLGSYTVSAFRPDFSDGNLVDTKLVFKDEVRQANVTFRGTGRVTGIVLNATGTTPLAATVGLSELKVKTGLLRPPENTNCFSNITVGDQVVELPQCVTVGIGFELVRLTRQGPNDPSAGTFAFENVLVGGFTLEAGNAFNGVTTVSRTIPAHGATTHVVLNLSDTGVVAGTVYRPDGLTPVGEDVVVTFDSGAIEERVTTCDATGGAPDPPCGPGESGRYYFPLVNPSSFRLTAEDPVTGLVGQSLGAVGAGRTVEIPIRLLGLGTVTVDVLGSNGPINGAVVTLRRGTFPDEQRQGTTGIDGIITFAGGDSITEGPFSVSAVDPDTGIRGFASATLPGPDAHVDVQIVLPDEAGTVRGRFVRTDGVTGIANAQIHLAAVGGEAFTTTGVDGDFVFEGVRLGSFSVDGFDPTTGRRGRSTGQLVANHEEVTVEIGEVPQGTVRGFVRLSAGLAPVAGANVSISVSGAFGASMRTTSGADGGFVFPGVSAGNFSASASDPQTGLSASTAGSLASEGQVVDVEVVLPVPQVGRVEGVVAGADGSPPVGAQVALGSRQTTTDAAGFYSFENVGVGPVSLFASALIGVDAGVGSGEVAFDGDVERVDIRFVGTGTVEGVVATGSGDPVPFARVVLTRRTAIPRSFVAETQTGTDGTFRFDGVLVGDVSVTATQSVTLLAGSRSGTLPTDGAAITLDVVLEPAAELRGRVLREDGVTPAAGMALEVANGSRRFGTTPSDGTFRFANLSLDSYTLTITDPLGTGLARATAALTAEGQVVDLGDVVLDEARPSVVSIQPTNGAIHVPVGASIQVAFSEPVDPATVTNATLPVSTPTGLVAGAWILNAERTHVTFVPAAPFRDFTPVTVKVTTAVHDRVGRSPASEVVSSFVTADATPPVTVSLSPASGSRNVPLESVIRVAYSEAIDPSRFGGSAIAVSRGGTGVTGRVDVILNNTAMVFTPAAALVPNATYQVTILPAADVFGNVQSTGSLYTFSTLDTEPPVIVALSAPGGTTVFEGATISVTADVGAASDVAFVEFVVNGQSAQTDRAAPFALSLPVTASLGPTVTVAARATDLSGNTGPEQTLGFTVQADALPLVTIVSPAEASVASTGSRVTVSVHASDDFGVAQVVFQATGAVSASAAQLVSPAVASHDAVFEFDVPADAIPGAAITLRATAIDTRGQSSSLASVSLVVGDATPPAITISSPVGGMRVAPGDNVTVLVSAQDAGGIATISFQATGAASAAESRGVTPPITNAATSFQFAVPAGAVPNQTISLTAQASDTAGNTRQTDPLVLVVRDASPPAVTVATADGATQAVRGRTVTILVSATDDVGVTSFAFQTQGAFVASGSRAITSQTSASTEFTIQVPESAADGTTLTIVASAQDAQGNSGVSSALSLPVVSAPTPVILDVSPASASPGSVLTLILDAVNTNFVAGQTQARLGAGVRVGNGAEGAFGPVAVESATRIRMEIEVSVLATLGPRTVAVTTGNEQVDLADGFAVVPRVVLPPVIRGPLAAGSTVVSLSNVAAGAEVRVFSGGAVLATEIVPADAGGVDVAVPQLVAGERLSASQRLAGVESAFSSEVVVGAVPAAPAITEPLFAGSAIVAVTGVSEGADVNVFANGVLIGAAVVPAGQRSADVPVDPVLAIGSAVSAVQRVNGSASEPSRAAMVVDGVPPRVRGPLAAGVDRITVEGAAPGAFVRVLIDGTVAGEQRARGTVVEVGVAPLAAGASVSAFQVAGGLTSPAALPVAVGTVPPAPSIDGPLFAGGRVVVVTGATQGAAVGLFVGGSPIANTMASGPTVAFSLASDLAAGAQVTATQTLAGVTSPAAQPVIVVAPPAPTLGSIVGSGSQTLTLGNLVPGSQGEVQADGVVIGSGEAPARGRLDVPVLPRMEGDELTARQFALDAAGPESAPVVVGATPAAPAVAGPLFGGGQLVRVPGVSPGATVDLFADGALITSRVVPPGATDVDLALGAGVTAGASLAATQTLNSVTSAPSPAIVVGEASAPVLPAQVLTTERAIVVSGVSGGAYVALLADGVAVSAGVVPEGANTLTLLVSRLTNGTSLAARQSAFGVTSALSSAVTATAPPPVLSLDPESLTVAFGATGTLTVGSSVPAPPGGLSVTVTAAPQGVITLTSPVVIPEGATEQAFSITAEALGDATVTAEAAGYVSAQAQVVVPTPTITGISPSSALQGSVINATIAGSHLSGASAIAFTGGGLTGTIQSASQTAVAVTIVIPPDAPVGAYGFTLTLPSGELDSGSVRIIVGAPFQGQSAATSPPVSVFFSQFQGQGVGTSPPVSVFFPSFSGQGVSTSPPVSVFFPSFSGQGVSTSPPVTVFFPSFSGQGVGASSPISVFFNHFVGQGVAVSPPVSVEKTE